MAATQTLTTKASKDVVKPKKSLASAIGAPAQRSQPSRKGKRAWRKNIDVDEVEEGLEELRMEERVTGSTLQSKKDEELFAIDTKGDEKVRRSLPRFSTALLTSTKILNERSAVPAVTSRIQQTSIASKRKLSHEEKAQLLRIGKRKRRGPLNSYVDETELNAGSALMEITEAVKNSGSYDVWESQEDDDRIPEVVRKPKIKAPKLAHPRDAIAIPSIVQPHQGVSYNPLASAHQELLSNAQAIEVRREQEAKKNETWAATMEKVRRAALVEETPGVPAGMTVGEGTDVSEDEEWGGIHIPKKRPQRKTKQQRVKAAKLLAEKRALAEKAANRRMLASLSTAKALRASLDKSQVARAIEQEKRSIALREKLQQGLAGHRIGKHRVAEASIDVQLGEELSESLRGLKPEGNLFRDRFHSMQTRGLIEPRALVVAKKREAKTKEYEKHAWKRFE